MSPFSYWSCVSPVFQTLCLSFLGMSVCLFRRAVLGKQPTVTVSLWLCQASYAPGLHPR